MSQHREPTYYRTADRPPYLPRGFCVRTSLVSFLCAASVMALWFAG